MKIYCEGHVTCTYLHLLADIWCSENHWCPWHDLTCAGSSLHGACDSIWYRGECDLAKDWLWADPSRCRETCCRISASWFSTVDAEVGTSSNYFKLLLTNSDHIVTENLVNKSCASGSLKYHSCQTVFLSWVHCLSTYFSLEMKVDKWCRRGLEYLPLDWWGHSVEWAGWSYTNLC